MPLSTNKQVIFGGGLAIFAGLFIFAGVYFFSGSAAGSSPEEDSGPESAPRDGPSVPEKLKELSGSQEPEEPKNVPAVPPFKPRIITFSSKPISGEDMLKNMPVIPPKSKEEIKREACELAKKKMETAMDVKNTKDELENCFQKIIESCDDAKNSSLAYYVKLSFEAKKTAAIKCAHPIWRDFERLLIIQRNLKAVDKAYKETIPLKQEFCDVFGPKFTKLFGTVETDPSISNAEKLVKYAADAFYFAKMFCEGTNAHPAYDYSTLNIFLIEHIKQLSEPFDAQIYKYIKILRLLNPESLWAFNDCDDLEELKTKVVTAKADRDHLKNMKMDFHSGLFKVEDLEKYSPEFLEKMAEEAERMAGQASLTEQAKYAALTNSSLFLLVGLVKKNFPSDEDSQKWMKSGFPVVEKDDKNQLFIDFLKRSSELAHKKATLLRIFEKLRNFHLSKAEYLEESGIFNDSEKHVTQHAICEMCFKQIKEGLLRGKALVELCELVNNTFIPYHDRTSYRHMSSIDTYSREFGHAFMYLVEALRETSSRVLKARRNHKYYIHAIEALKADENGSFIERPCPGIPGFWTWPGPD